MATQLPGAMHDTDVRKSPVTVLVRAHALPLYFHAAGPPPGSARPTATQKVADAHDVEPTAPTSLKVIVLAADQDVRGRDSRALGALQAYRSQLCQRKKDAGEVFSRTRVPLRLLTDNGVSLDSRAQARWVVSRLELFATAELDFDGVDDVGPSFIDEVFRVYAKAHPEVDLQPTKVSGHVQKLLKGSIH